MRHGKREGGDQKKKKKEEEENNLFIACLNFYTLKEHLLRHRIKLHKLYNVKSIKDLSRERELKFKNFNTQG